MNAKDSKTKMLESSIPYLILTLSLPAIISNLISNIYNLVDTYYVGLLNTSASGAVGILFTLMSILQAVAFMLGQGAGVNISRRLAESDKENASRYASVSFFMSFIFGLIIMLFGIIFLNGFMLLLGSTDTILPYAKDYGLWILLAAPGMMGSLVLNSIFRYEGKTLMGMIGIAVGTVVNLFGDPIFMFTLNLGITGAGISTLIGQYISFIILLILYIFKSDCKLSFSYWFSGMKYFLTIVKNGFPSLIRQGLNSISSGALNWCAKGYGDACVSALSIVGRINHFLVSICIGLGQGFQPVAGFNYQAKKYDRLKKAYFFTLFTSICIFIVLGSITVIFAREIVSLFIKDGNVINIATPALRFTCMGLLFLPISTTANMLYQSTGQALKASFLACLRGGLCFIPILFIFNSLFHLKGIEMSTGIGDVLASLLCLPFVIVFIKKISNNNIEQRS